MALLFRVKQVLFAVLGLLPQGAAVAGYPLVEEAAVREVYALLHAPGDPAARFVLSTARSGALQAAREAELGCQRSLLSARASGEEDQRLGQLQSAHEAARAALLKVETEVLSEVAEALRPAVATIAEAFA